MPRAAPPITGTSHRVRIEPLAVLPIFFKLRGKRALVAGGDLPAVWKTELLSAAGAAVDVVSPELCREMIELGEAPPDGTIRLVQRDWITADLQGAAIAIGSFEDEEEAKRFQQAARQAGVPVNVIDKPAFCDFQFGTVVSRSPLVLGISTDGAAPVFGQAIRARIEALLPQHLTEWAKAARDWRPALQALKLDFQARRRFWDVFATRALTADDRGPDEQDREAALAEALADQGPEKRTSLTLVGSGSGSPDEVTLRAIRALQSAETVLHGPDIPPTVVRFARREALKQPIDHRRGHGLPAGVTQTLQQAGSIVWLDEGDPMTCLRWRERQQRLTQAGLSVALVAGLGRCRDCGPACAAWPRPA